MNISNVIVKTKMDRWSTMACRNRCSISEGSSALGVCLLWGSEFAKTSDRGGHLFHKNIKNNDNTSSRLKTVTYTSTDSESFLKCSFEHGSIP